MPETKSYPSQYEKVKEITDQLEAGIQALFESDTFRQYLRTMSKFHDYSLGNTILIAMQKPDATLVAGYTSWQKQFGRQVQKGERESGSSHQPHIRSGCRWIRRIRIPGRF